MGNTWFEGENKRVSLSANQRTKFLKFDTLRIPEISDSVEKRDKNRKPPIVGGFLHTYFPVFDFVMISSTIPYFFASSAVM